MNSVAIYHDFRYCSAYPYGKMTQFPPQCLDFMERQVFTNLYDELFPKDPKNEPPNSPPSIFVLAGE